MAADTPVRVLRRGCAGVGAYSGTDAGMRCDAGVPVILCYDDGMDCRRYQGEHAIHTLPGNGALLRLAHFSVMHLYLNVFSGFGFCIYNAVKVFAFRFIHTISHLQFRIHDFGYG